MQKQGQQVLQKQACSSACRTSTLTGRSLAGKTGLDCHHGLSNVQCHGVPATELLCAQWVQAPPTVDITQWMPAGHMTHMSLWLTLQSLQSIIQERGFCLACLSLVCNASGSHPKRDCLTGSSQACLQDTKNDHGPCCKNVSQEHGRLS